MLKLGKSKSFILGFFSKEIKLKECTHATANVSLVGH